MRIIVRFQVQVIGIGSGSSLLLQAVYAQLFVFRVPALVRQQERQRDREAVQAYPAAEHAQLFGVRSSRVCCPGEIGVNRSGTRCVLP